MSMCWMQVLQLASSNFQCAGRKFLIHQKVFSKFSYLYWWKLTSTELMSQAPDQRATNSMDRCPMISRCFLMVITAMMPSSARSCIHQNYFILIMRWRHSRAASSSSETGRDQRQAVQQVKEHRWTATALVSRVCRSARHHTLGTVE